MISCPDSVEDGRVAAGRELVELVVQPLVDDLLGPQTVQLVRELLDACRDLFWQLSPRFFLPMVGYDNLGKSNAL